MSFNEWSTIINTFVGIVGTIVGIIGWRSLNSAVKIKNGAKNLNNSSLQQAQIINNGLDSYAVIRLSKETTQKELADIISRIDITDLKISSIENKFSGEPKIHTGSEPPKESKEGDIWIQIDDDL